MKIKDIAVIVVFAGLLAVLGVGALLLPDQAVSESERRPLVQFAPFAEKKQEAEEKGGEYGVKEYTAFLESYTLDQFPARDTFRQIKSLYSLLLLRQRDNNGYYAVGENLSKMDSKKNDAAIGDAVRRINAIYETYLKRLDASAYYCLIPDKNYYLAEENGYLHYDYDAFYSAVSGAMDAQIEEIDIRALLSADSYYRTDPHWNQKEILPVADALLREMGTENAASAHTWQIHELAPFYGTYYGQLALPVRPDTLSYLTCPELDGVRVYDYAARETVPIYEERDFENVDPYDVFLGGAVPLLRIDNPNGTIQKQLVVFRDSFGSSLVPLLAAEYTEVLVADIRYISPSTLFPMTHIRSGCDVLFLYATSVLNTYGTFMN